LSIESTEKTCDFENVRFNVYRSIDFYVRVFRSDETNRKNDCVIHDEPIEDIDQILN